MGRIVGLCGAGRLSLLAAALVWGCGTGSGGDAGSGGGNGGGGAPTSWTAGLTATNPEGATIAGTTYLSSTRLEIRWKPPSPAPTRYELTAGESVAGSQVAATADGAATSATLTGLKAGTAYTISARAIYTAGRQTTVDADVSATATTGEERWQLLGTGNGFDNATRVLTDANNIAAVFRYGSNAGGGLAGSIRLYYHPFPRVDPAAGIRAALTPGVATADPSSVAAFVDDGDFGLRDPSTPATLVSRLATYQAVPLAPALGGSVRLFFEAEDAGGTVRLLYLDSQDGWAGRDFHPGAATVVATQVDYDTGGPAEPQIAVGVEGDDPGGDSGLTMARQSKVGWPWLDDWTWDGAVGTFMVITGADAAGQTRDGLFYATWDGSRWNVVKDGSGRARPLVLYAHGPVIDHLGQRRYKLYFEHRSGPGQNLNKPLHLVYADAARSGDPAKVEIDDWETETAAREVHFLWPDGTPLTANEESGLGDHMILHPTGEADVQVMYVNLGGLDMTPATASQGIGVAALVNP